MSMHALMRIGYAVAVVVLTCWVSVAAGEDPGAAPAGTHLETPSTDPYLPPPPQPERSGPARPWVRGKFQSVQVNVNALGQDIQGDAANEPSIAVNPTNPDNIVIGWRQFDNIASAFRQAGYAYTFDGGQTWTFPGVLETQVFRSDPVLEGGPDGTIFYYSLDFNFACQMFRSLDGGVTWSAPTPAFGDDKAWMAIDKTNGVGRGNIYLFWTGNQEFTRSTDGGSSYLSPLQTPLSFLKWGTMDVGPAGTLYMVDAGCGVVTSDNAQNPAVTPTFSPRRQTTLQCGFGNLPPNPHGLAGQMIIAADHSMGLASQRVYAIAPAPSPGTDDPLDVYLARSDDRGATWNPPIRINDDPFSANAYQWFPTMSVAPNGRIDVIWNDTRESGVANISELYYTFSTDGGETWAPQVPVSPPFNSHLGWPGGQQKIGDYYDMESDNLGASIAYAATFNGGQDVYFLRLTVGDCNENGIPDAQEIEAGSSDCNENGIPDECELDCDANGVADECEIAADPSLDLDQDGHLDICSVLRVSSGASPGGSGASWDHAIDDVNQALEACAQSAGAVREIWVASGTYLPDEAGQDKDASFAIPNGCKVFGGFAGTETQRNERDPAQHITILSGDLLQNDGPDFTNYEDNSKHVVSLDGTGTDTLIDGFLIRGGYFIPAPANRGAGITCANSQATIAHCRITENYANLGGGIAISGDVSPLIVNTTFARNRAVNAGGAGYGDLSDPVFVNSIFAGNEAPLGGALFLQLSAGSIINCNFVGNLASQGAAGIRFTGLTAIKNTLFWDNVDPSGRTQNAQITNAASTVPSISHCGIDGYTGTPAWPETSAADPQFADPLGPDGLVGTFDDDYSLASDSPYLDAGLNDALPADRADLDHDGDVTEPTPLDIFGQLRVVGESVDIGAIERQSTAPLFGDFDGDGALDLQDYEVLSICLTASGPDRPVLFQACRDVFDADHDDDIDLYDVSTWLALPAD